MTAKRFALGVCALLVGVAFVAGIAYTSYRFGTHVSTLDQEPVCQLRLIGVYKRTWEKSTKGRKELRNWLVDQLDNSLTVLKGHRNVVDAQTRETVEQAIAQAESLKRQLSESSKRQPERGGTTKSGQSP